nr:4Fe-4S dicluster domain-containing protein [uncultured Bacillus sp.]
MNIKLGFKMNLHRCVGCHACELACKNEHGLKVSRRRVRSIEETKLNHLVFFSMSCNHCENPACIGVCPDHCFKKRRDGVVILDTTNCSGCMNCLGICPFDAVQLNPVTGKIDKCNMCADRMDQGLKPACVSACITNALEIQNMLEPMESNEQKWISEIKFVNFTNPSVRFVPPKKAVCYLREAIT